MIQGILHSLQSGSSTPNSRFTALTSGPAIQSFGSLGPNSQIKCAATQQRNRRAKIGFQHLLLLTHVRSIFNSIMKMQCLRRRLSCVQQHVWHVPFRDCLSPSRRSLQQTTAPLTGQAAAAAGANDNGVSMHSVTPQVSAPVMPASVTMQFLINQGIG